VVPALLVIALIFAVLFVFRMGGSYRAELVRRWPAALLAGAAIFAVFRGAAWPAIALAALAALAWIVWPSLSAKASAPVHDDPADAEARAILGVGPTATASEIRSAYRAKMTRAHPDRGGSNAEAARLTAARDRLLRKR
jgi:lysylphosphatidylglycerol synthetase-like protein (DUF2156 family)